MKFLILYMVFRRSTRSQNPMSLYESATSCLYIRCSSVNRNYETTSEFTRRHYCTVGTIMVRSVSLVEQIPVFLAIATTSLISFSFYFGVVCAVPPSTCARPGTGAGPAAPRDHRVPPEAQQQQRGPAAAGSGPRRLSPSGSAAS